MKKFHPVFALLGLATALSSHAEVTVEYNLQNDWDVGGMSSVVIRNHGTAPVETWQVTWDWPGDQTITSTWNAYVTQTGNNVIADCADSFCFIGPGEAQSFGFVFEYSGQNPSPVVQLVSSDTPEPPPEEPPEEPPTDTPDGGSGEPDTPPNPGIDPTPSSDLCTEDTGMTATYTQVQDWSSGGMASVVVRNHGDAPMSDWHMKWQWPGDTTITHHWNAAVTQTGQDVTAQCEGSYCDIPVGQAQSFGFNLAYSQAGSAPVISLHSPSCESSGGQQPPPSTGGDGTPVTDTFNYVLGTQTISPHYGFTEESRLVETAKVIRAMGSNILKMALDTNQYEGTSGYSYQFKELVENEPSFKEVLGMDFTYYLMWAEDSGSWTDNNGLDATESQQQYDKIYALTAHLLETYSGTGKSFFIGNWEGDWQLTSFNAAQQTVHPLRIQGMIDWLNIRQKAVDDAKANVAHNDVHVYHYVELNHTLQAQQGYDRVANKVLPHISPDFVSYSAYDVTLPEENVASYDHMRAALGGALDYLEDQLPHKTGLPFEKRVFIGEYGYASSWFTNPPQGMNAHDLQDHLSRLVMKASIDWGVPFALYWQIYDNEYDSYLGAYKGYWMIDHEGNKKPTYFTHETFYQNASAWQASFETTHGRQPTADEFKAQAIAILDNLNAPEEPVASSDEVNILFVGDSITYGMNSTAYHNGFRKQVMDLMKQAADTGSALPFSITEASGQTHIHYAGSRIEYIGAVNGPSSYPVLDIAQHTENYQHSGIPGATTADILCLLDSQFSHPSGYAKTSCAESINHFNNTSGLSCYANPQQGWLGDSGCHINTPASGEALVVPVQLGTNDITFMSGLSCQAPITTGSSNAQLLADVVKRIVDKDNPSNPHSIVGKLAEHYRAQGIDTDKQAFVISKIPKRTAADGKDPWNHCTDYYNGLIADTVGNVNGIHITLADQGNVVPQNSDSVHPDDTGHSTMACNLMTGASHAGLSGTSCLLPGTTPAQGLVKALSLVTQ